MSVYVTADLHLGDERVIQFERTCFKTVEEHDKAIIEGINSVVDADDTLYILGDVGFFSSSHPLEKLIKQVSKIKGHKIFVKGNHDRFGLLDAKRMGFEEIHMGPMYYSSCGVNGHIILSHEPVAEAYNNPYVINVHGHLHNSDLELPNFYNVNIGRTYYRPVDMNGFLRIARECKSRQEKFMQEWYKDYYSNKNLERKEEHNQ